MGEKLILDKEVEKSIKTYPHKSFKNEYGEKFTIYSDGVMVFMSGDETDNEFICLFNPDFSIWNRAELYELGKALMELHKPIKGEE